ncbi:MAG: ATP-dependent DNA helicase UvrD2 [Acidimicrobiales bacterium]|nr:ATP-dependent DNA helicase UvrD2 [Acidimicrobiales bacterium]
MDPEALLDGLDDRQRLAVTSTALPLVVLAPAGSGKTRVLTRRIAYRVAMGAADPRHVLALTFTRKAAGELSERLGRLGLRSDATTGTFHGVAWGALRARWADQGRTPLTLLERKGRLLVEVAPRAVGRDQRSVAADLGTEIEWAKARMITPEAYPEAVVAAGRRSALRSELVVQGYKDYETRKQRAGLADFDDLLALCARALEEDERFASAQRWRFRHLYVDELQDVNALQFRLLEAWRGHGYDVTAVGDPQQAIYGWNGADASFLLEIHRHWPPASVIELDRSYRSSPQILAAAVAVLQGGRQAAREVHSQRPDGPAPSVASHPTDRAEAIAVARAVRRGHAPGRPWSDQAILVRTHAQTELLTEALRESGIPHRLRGGADFLERPAVRRAMRELRSGGAPLGTALADLELSLEDGVVPGVVDVHIDADDEDIEEQRLRLAQHDEDRAVLASLVRMGRDYLRLDPVGGASSFSGWLTATVRSEADSAAPDRDAVDIATFHAAKGLEWGTVHLAGIEDGYVPIALARTPAARAEEVRLLYVAMTRAQRELRITWAQQRTFSARVVDRRRSPLLAPIPDRVPGEDDPVPSLPTPPVDDWAEEVARQRAALRPGGSGASADLEALHRWRDGVARAARVVPETVLPDHVLARIAKVRPTDVAALGGIRGVGEILAARFGADVLAALVHPPVGSPAP